jgi:hypothetical protein
MKQRILFGVATLLLVELASAGGITFADVVDNLDRSVHTAMNIKEYWKGVEGKEVTWSGQVHDVESGKSQVRILVIDKSRPLYKGYNIRVITEDFSKASSLKKGQQIRFKGVLDGFHSKDDGAVIDLSEATIF